MNCVLICGRLCKDPEISTSGSTTYAKYSIAVDRKYKKEGEQNADFFNCVSFGKTAEFCEKWLHKGTKVILRGRIETDNYTNKNGEKVYGVKIIAEEIEFAESKKTAEENNIETGKNKENSFVNVDDGEDLPFN